jgi:hypothetical protein
MRSRVLKYQQDLPFVAFPVRTALGAFSACAILFRTVCAILFFCLATTVGECSRTGQQYGRHGQ